MSRVADAVYSRLPRLRYEIESRRGNTWVRDIDLDAIAQLEQVSGLEDQQRLEGFLPRLGINDDMPELFPPHLHWALGKGLKVWQYPSQFAPYLVHIARRPVRSYLEIGVQHGGSFITTVEYLRHQGHPVERAVAVDFKWAPGVARYLKTRPFAEQVTLDSTSAKFRAFARNETWDLVLIDGDHRFNECLMDFETIHEHANAIAFHDIVDSLATEVRDVWELVRREHADTYDFAEFTTQYPEVASDRTYLGIGVASRRGAFDRADASEAPAVA
jgi:cephalosporin hydroxylase